jgi:hypothetical protein
LEAGGVVTVTEEAYFEVVFPYLAMNEVMKTIKSDRPRVVEQQLDNLCHMVLATPRSEADVLQGKLGAIDGAQVTFLYFK